MRSGIRSLVVMIFSRVSNWFRRLGTTEVYIFDGTSVTAAKGNPKPKLIGELRGILQRTGSGTSEIHLNGNQKIQFYGDINPRAHQSIRNVFINTL
jgi:hypothetical protein